MQSIIKSPDPLVLITNYLGSKRHLYKITALPRLAVEIHDRHFVDREAINFIIEMMMDRWSIPQLEEI